MCAHLGQKSLRPLIFLGLFKLNAPGLFKLNAPQKQIHAARPNPLNAFLAMVLSASVKWKQPAMAEQIKKAITGT